MENSNYEEGRMKISEIKNIANQRIATLRYKSGKTAIETLQTIKFNIPVGCNLFTQKEIAEQNIRLDQASCLGRVAQAIAIVEKHHPTSHVEVAEVMDDYFQSIMMRKLARNSHDDTFMQELLMYEEPHSVLVVNGKQFDPISTMLDVGDITHPRVESNPPWESICADILIAQSHLTDNERNKMDLLNEAERVCPNLLVVAENMVGAFIRLGNIDMAIEKLEQILVRRVTARSLYGMYLLTDDEAYYEKLSNIYTKNIMKHLECIGKEG